MKIATLMITLRRKGPGSPHEVRTVEFTEDGVNQRMSSAQVRTTAGVFHPTLALVIEDAARNIGQTRSAVSSPDKVVSLPGLVLGRMYVSTPGVAVSGEQGVMVMFRSAIGAFGGALLDGFTVQAATFRDEIEARLLSDIATPILDLLAGLGHVSPHRDCATALTARLDKLAEDRDEIVFYINLLKRYVQNAHHRETFVNRLESGTRPANMMPCGVSSVQNGINA